MNVVVAGGIKRHQLCGFAKGSAVVAAEVGVQVELGLDPTLVDGMLYPGDDHRLHPLDGLGSRQLAKSIVVEVPIVFVLGARINNPSTLKQSTAPSL